MSGHETLEDAEALLRHAAQKGLGSRTRLRLLAITLWASFLGAIPTLLMVLALLPAENHAPLSLGRLSLMFFAAWLCAFIPASIGVLLSHPRSWPPLSHARKHEH